MGASTPPIDRGPPPDGLSPNANRSSDSGAANEGTSNSTTLSNEAVTPAVNRLSASSVNQNEDATEQSEATTAQSSAPTSLPSSSATAKGSAPSSKDSRTRPSTSSSSPAFPKRFEEDGDAEMEGQAPDEKKPFSSALQVGAEGFSVGTSSPPASQPAPSRRSSKAKAPSTKSTGKKIGAPRPAGDAPNVWSTLGAAQLRATLSGTQSQPPIGQLSSAARSGHHPPLEMLGPSLRNHYLCAVIPATLRRDGDQRAMTTNEQEALFPWLSHQLHLAEPPLFLMETHTTAERGVLYDFHLDLGFRLYGILPAGIKLSDVNVKYHLVHTALLACGQDRQLLATLKELFADTYTITCVPNSQVVVLRFIYPKILSKWMNFALPFGQSAILLQVTDSLTTDTPRAGYDAAARKLLYHVFLCGPSSLRHQEVRAIGAAAAGIPVLGVEYIDSIGLSDFAPPRWKLTFDQITCLTALEKIRRIKGTYDGREYSSDVHHPHAARRAPCGKCLSVRHVTCDCKNVHAAASLASHTIERNLELISGSPNIMPTISRKKLRCQVKRLRAQVAPDPAQRLSDEEKERLHKLEVKIMAAKNKAVKEAAADIRAKLQAQVQAKQDKQRKQRELARAAHKNVNSRFATCSAKRTFRWHNPLPIHKHHKAPINEATTALKPSVTAGAETEARPQKLERR